MKATIPYKHGDKVYLLNDPYQVEYIIVAFILWPNQLLQLKVSDGGYHFDVFEFETSRERDILKAESAENEDDDE